MGRVCVTHMREMWQNSLLDLVVHGLYGFIHSITKYSRSTSTFQALLYLMETIRQRTCLHAADSLPGETDNK